MRDVDVGGTTDCVLLAGSQSNGVTSLTWSRKLDTGDTYDYAFTDSLQWFAWAWCDQDGSGLTYPKHRTTGSAQINVITGEVIAHGALTPDQIVITVMVCLLVSYTLVRCCHRTCKPKSIIWQTAEGTVLISSGDENRSFHSDVCRFAICASSRICFSYSCV